ncbi:hypothetical protein D0864_11205 [Hortaea werneckii]|uniref:Protein phosphatase 4 core regulatory subunit R2 n=1 Tax=Hortaea werneckii TaxID=91943 RepID=A0A3M7DY36_HORWE|nr:hypothetical protein KC338_g4716 [Hortaea werneckii]RMY69023.1 hypothetical protein D0864_11205 [Hortaea werneckii]
MRSAEELLRQASQDGSIDIAEWPRVLETVLQRLHDIVYNDFPKPSIPLPAPLPSTIDPEVVASTPPQVPASQPGQQEDLPDTHNYPPNSQNSAKENDEPTVIAARPHAPGFDRTPAAHQPVQPPDSMEMDAGTLPPDLLSLYQNTTRALEHGFPHSPPHTIQRLAELVLDPRKYYRFLPSYLRALDRVVSVSSPLSDFPLPTLHADNTGGFLTNGDSSQANGITEREGLGSDESLGGALLTPIPWLQENRMNRRGSNERGELHTENTEMIEGPNGTFGTIETVTATVNGVSSTHQAQQTFYESPSASTDRGNVADSATGSTSDAQLRQQGAVTQGELLRQEQESGVMPMNQTTPRRQLISGGAAAVGREPVGGTVSPSVPSDTAANTEGDAMEEDSKSPDEALHAHSGPETVGVEDMGPQHQPLGAQGLDMEAAVGRQKSPPLQQGSEIPPAPQVAEEAEKEAQEPGAGQRGKDPQDQEKDIERKREEENEAKAKEARESNDVVVADADGRPAEEADKAEVTGDLSGADAADTTTL